MKWERRCTAERLRELLDYDPVTGEFTWRVNRGGTARKGARAGRLNSQGRRQISIDLRCYCAGPLAVLWMTGQWPERLVDHRNLSKADDRWDNLRPATYSQNSANRRSWSELKGTHLVDGKFQSRIMVAGRYIYLGLFDRPEDAHAAYVAAALEHFGEFARTE